MTEEQLNSLKSKLWDVANILRGRMNADEFRDYMLGFIFYKYLSEKMEHYADDALIHDNITFSEIDEADDVGQAFLEAVKTEALETLGYFLKPSELFRAVAERGNNPDNHIIADLRNIFRNIEDSAIGQQSENEFTDLFEDLDLDNSRLGKREADKNQLITSVMLTLDQIDFGLNEANGDILGDAYEYLIGEFAATAGKKAGEFYTPPQVSTILTRIVATDSNGNGTKTKSKIKSVYDPTCGSGSLLLRFKREGIQIGTYFGQELNRTTYNLARMNMILHDVHYRDFDLRQDDVIEYPAEEHDGMLFDAVVANPPFSAKWSANDIYRGDHRFSDFPDLAPASKADYCFVLHMLSHLSDSGTMAVILPHGALFRGNAEGRIREYLIKRKNWLDAVIGLPANVFYGTSIPACIMVFRKCREDEDNIIFIDASQHFTKVKNRNELSDEDIARIISAYRAREESERYARPVSRQEIAENGYNLNIPRYVDTSEPEEEIDLDEVINQLAEIDKELADSAKEIRAFCAELGIKPPC